MRKTVRVKLGGKQWVIKHVPKIKGAWADCDCEKRVIRVSEDMDSELMLDCLIHESLHAIYPFLKESSVEKGATELKNVLCTLGYRRVK